MLAEAARRFSVAGVAANLKRADVRKLPFPSNHFDVVVAAHVVEHMPDPLVALEEMHRVLKPGGQLVVCLTRRSIAGAYIHFKWRTHQLTSATVERWFDTVGLSSENVTSAPSGWLRAASLAFFGLKPIKASD